MKRLLIVCSSLALLAACSENPDTGSDTSADDETEGLPGNDIHIYALSWENGLPVLGERVGGIVREGYDNQPFFTPDSESILYTRGDESGETDIWRYSLVNDVSHQITDTPDASEYSPQIPPSEAELSYLYQPPGGYAGSTYLANADNSGAYAAHELAPVGYYAFSGDMRYVVTFALGQPNTLQRIDRTTTPETVSHVIDNPSRTLIMAPRGHGMFYAVADEPQNPKTPRI